MHIHYMQCFIHGVEKGDMFGWGCVGDVDKRKMVGGVKLCLQKGVILNDYSISRGGCGRMCPLLYRV